LGYATRKSVRSSYIFGSEAAERLARRGVGLPLGARFDAEPGIKAALRVRIQRDPASRAIEKSGQNSANPAASSSMKSKERLRAPRRPIP
jgi:hypothetical protein